MPPQSGIRSVMCTLLNVMCSVHIIRLGPRSALLFGLTVAACWSDDDLGTPLAIELAGPDEGRVGEELSVRYEVNGRQLVGIIVAWGDGVADSVPARGAQTASGSVHHTYTDSGRFTVTGTAEDVVEGVVEDRVEIDILP